MNARRPVLVVVTGHPASGKTSLAMSIGDALGVPVFTKDGLKERLHDLLGGDGADRSHQLGKAATFVLYDAIRSLLRAGVDVVAEANFPHAYATELIEMLVEVGGGCVRVVVDAEPEALVERYRERAERGERHPVHADIGDLEDVERLVSEPYTPPSVPGPLLQVDSTDPSCLDDPGIVERVRQAIEQARGGERPPAESIA